MKDGERERGKGRGREGERDAGYLISFRITTTSAFLPTKQITLVFIFVTKSLLTE